MRGGLIGVRHDPVLKKALVHIPPTAGRRAFTWTASTFWRQWGWTHIPGAGADQLLELILLDGMTNPADGTTQRKQRRCGAGGQVERADENRKGEVNGRGFSYHLTRLLYHRMCEHGSRG